MKRLLGVIALILVGGLVALALSFRAAVLPVDDSGALAVPVAHPPADLTLAVAHAGKMVSQAGFAYRGGDLREQRTFGMAGVLVSHPQGKLLIDAGFGRNIDRHVLTMPWLMQKLSRYETETPVAEQLQAAGIEPAQLKAIVLTHAHWDHVSGVEDLPGVPVWLPQAERDFIDSGDPATALARSFGALNYHIYDFPDRPYLGFDASFDVFKDGSVVIVPAGGHTPGSVIVFVTLPDQKRYAFVGDLVWQREAVAIPAERPWLSRRLVDKDDPLVRARIAQLHRVAALVPNLVVVPAHDRRVLETLPPLRRPEPSA
jgi:N-acyl homoserine lactone hydrolase